MTGPEHYREAERLLTPTMTTGPFGDSETLPSQGDIETAKVHATLALAAATVGQIAARGPGDVEREWTDTLWPVTP